MTAARIALAALLVLALAAPALAYEDVIQLWDASQTPAGPELKPVALDPATTALLVLDMETRTCNAERRPRCLETLPRLAALVQLARKAGASVVYSLTSKGTPETILPEVAPQPGEAIVKSSVDKFLGTDLAAILEQKGVKTVIVTGTAAHGALLFTATAAAQRGLTVVVPVDGLSAEDLFTEQAAVWVLATGPGARNRLTLTRADMLTFK